MENLKQFLKENPEPETSSRYGAGQNDLILVGGVILISLISFGAGRLTAPETVGPEPIVIEQVNREVAKKSNDIFGVEVGLLVASINGTKYHLPECSGAKRIKKENKIWFNSIEEAVKMGYTPAANCPGL